MVPFLPAVVREAHHLFCVSSATQHDLIRHFPEARGKSSVVHNGLTPADKTRTGTDLDLPEAFVLFLGTREPRKNLSRLVVAMEKIWDDRPSFPDLLVAGGSGWGMPGFEERVRKSHHASRIRLLGYVEPAAAFELLRRASVLAYPSLYEGFGFPPIEAMECGTPVVASSSSSLPEICGDLALLPDPLLPGEIATALEQAVDDLVFRARARTEGPAHAASFTWQRAVRAMRPHFEAAVKGDPRSPA
jgi:alpha-1,3-rhamnosyl/mannosyltransferase